jgi:hypothetical protein
VALMVLDFERPSKKPDLQTSSGREERLGLGGLQVSLRSGQVIQVTVTISESSYSADSEV